MPYTVDANAGDCLCTIAHREGFSDCRPLRALPANNGFLNVILQAHDLISIPSWNEGTAAAFFATGMRHVFCCCLPTVIPQPTTLRIVRTRATPPANGDAINDIGISRFPPGVAVYPLDNDGTGHPAARVDFPDHTHRVYSAHAFADPNAFNIEVVDPNTANADVTVYLEALQPVYAMGALNAHQRFPAGAVRNARSLQVTCTQMAADATRHRSCYLRLVVDRADQQARPQQTLLVTDMTVAADPGVGIATPQVEILDHDIRATYEYAGCPLPAGQRCVLARAEIELRRGRSVDLEVRILRTNADGTNNDNGVVQRQHAERRILRNARRIWAQEELTFVIQRMDTVDPPNDMLTVGEPDQPNSSGHQQGSLTPGQIGFRINVNQFGGANTVHQVGPFNVPAGNTSVQTAQLIQQRVNALNILNLQVQRLANPAEGGAAQGSVDVLFARPNSFVTLTHLTGNNQQDSAQKVAVVHFDTANINQNNQATNARRGGTPMRRLLFKSYPTNHQRINIFVINDNTFGGLTTGSLHALAGVNLDVIQEVRNCLTMNADAMDANFDTLYVILPHELGHALTDADHLPLGENIDVGGLMFSIPNVQGNWYDNRRISGPGQPNHPYEHLGHLGGGVLGLVQVNTTTHAFIVANGSLNFNNR